MGIQLKNNASGTLATAINASDTGIVLTTGNGASFPTLGASDYFYATLESTGGTLEVVKATARSGDSLTIVRAQEGTTANSFAAGSRFELRVTAQSVIDAIEDRVAQHDQASEISIADAGSYYAATNVETALQEVASGLYYKQGATNSVVRTVQARLRDIVSLMDFVPPGTNTATTNCGQFLQNAIDEMSANGGGGVFVPAGAYLIGQNVTAKSNVSVYGVGAASKLLMSGNNRRCFSSSGNLQNVDFHGLFIDGQKPTVGWETSNNFDFAFRFGDTASAQDTKNIRIYDCTIKDVGLDGVYIENFSNFAIENCTFINCRRWGVVPQAGAHNSQYFRIENCFFDCDYGGGPPGKEYPLGAIDSEPDVGAASFMTYKNLQGTKNATLLYGSGTTVPGGTIESVVVSNANAYINNFGPYYIRNLVMNGVDAYLRMDNADAIPTPLNNIDVSWINSGRAQVRTATGRANLVPSDFYTPDLLGVVTHGIGGTGTLVGWTVQNIDGTPVLLPEIKIGAGTGFYTFPTTMSGTVTVGDQMIFFLEVERTDSNTPTNNYLSISIGGGTLLSRLVSVPTGISRWIIAREADSTVVNPTISLGLSGTPNAEVSIRLRKAFFYVNPTYIDFTSFVARPAPSFRQLSAWTGPALDSNIRNIDTLTLSADSSQNLDTIFTGYVGQRLSIYASFNPVTVRDNSVGGGNIRLQQAATSVVLDRVGSASVSQAITLVYNGTDWLQVS
jgi:hypothetical protein